MSANTSPIEDEFSRINIESKLAGKHTIPRLPNLSTSKRAEARSSNNLARSTSATNLNGVVSKTPTRLNQGHKVYSASKSENRRALNTQLTPDPVGAPGLSYMRETSSSSRKTSSPFVSNSPGARRMPTSQSLRDFSDQRYPPIARKTPGSQTPQAPQAQQIPQVQQTPQIPHTNYKPVDITNLDYGKPRARGRITNPNPNPNHTVSPPKRHASSPYTTPTTPKLDIYTRLYNDSKSRTPNLHHTQTPSNHTQTHQTHSNNQHTSQTNNCHVKPIQNQSNPLTTPRKLSGLHIEKEIVKIKELRELYDIIYQEDPTLFEPSEDSDFCVNVPTSSTEFTTNEEPNSPLDVYERGEIQRSKDIYFFPESQGANRRINIRNYNSNYGFDDQSGNYVVIPQDHIKYRYEILSVLGNGSFGNVVKCFDKKYTSETSRKNKTVAIKIIKNDLNWSVQAVYEIKMLKLLNIDKGPSSNDPYHIEYGRKECPILTYFDHFHFRGHMCIVTEALSVNLYSMLEIVKFQGLSLKVLKIFMKKILKGLEYIHSMDVLHCDIKPENIMIKLPPTSRIEDAEEDSLIVKIVDFGTSCIKNEISYSYIQSRFYRAPEVILGAKYDKMIDVWSLGCIATELFTGDALLPGRNELEQIALTLELFGAPNSSLILQQRNVLLKSIKEDRAVAKFDDTNMSNPTSLQAGKPDAKSIKKTLLYTLFDMEGKINMQFLNMRIQAAQNFASTSAPQSRRQYKVSSKSLDVTLRLRSCREEQRVAARFLKFLDRIFKWDPSHRADASQLLEDPFLS